MNRKNLNPYESPVTVKSQRRRKHWRRNLVILNAVLLIPLVAFFTAGLVATQQFNSSTDGMLITDTYVTAGPYPILAPLAMYFLIPNLVMMLFMFVANKNRRVD